MHKALREACAHERRNTAFIVTRIVFDVAAGRSMQPSVQIKKRPKSRILKITIIVITMILTTLIANSSR